MDDTTKPRQYRWTDEMEFMRPLHELMFFCYGDRILFGPFKGMQIPQYPIWDDGNIGCKLFGTYEHELHPYLEMALARKPKTIVNVGCAEGYYAVGLARLLPDVRVYAFDVNRESLQQCAEFAVKNDVGKRMVLREGATDPAVLDVGGDPPILYIVDCEGYELTLLDPEKCLVLQYSDIIVECHNFLDPNITTTLTNRFLPTHNVTRVTLVDLPPFIPTSSNWPAFLRVLMVIEKRPMEQNWLVMWAK